MRHDLGDGHVYHAIYCHLNALNVNEGDTIAAGAQLGELGDSCDGDNQQLSCPTFQAHLHFALHQDSLIGGSGTGGSYAGHAVVPEPFDGYEDLAQGMDLISGNGSGPTPPCQLIPPAGGILDDLGPCFRKFGTASYWKEDTAGYDGHLFWTIATADSQPDNWARWSIELEQAGDYEVRVHTDSTVAMSKQAPYRVRHAGAEDVVTIDQTAAAGWQNLGSFNFAAGGDQWVRLDDNTGEPVSANLKLVSDAVQLAPTTGADAGTATDSGVPDAAAEASGPDAGGADASTPDGTGTPDGTFPGADANPGSDAGRPSSGAGASPSDEGDSCACRAAPNSRRPVGWAAGLVLALVAVRAKRRRDSHGTPPRAL